MVWTRLRWNVSRADKRSRMERSIRLSSPVELNTIWRSALYVFFFQAEDGIRDLTVTGVQTCALPIYPGAALESKQSVMVADVHQDPRYLPTFGSTKSEIVVPVVTESGKPLGLIDVESEKLNAFTENDRDFLEHAAFLIAHALK